MTDRDRRIVENMPLVRVIIKKHFPNHTNDDDIFQIGCIGLIRSVDTYDPSKGSAFSTYAGRCIQNEILMEFRKKSYKLKTVSLEECICKNTEDEEIVIGDVWAFSKDEYFMDFDAFISTLTPLEKEICRCILSGMNQSETAKHIGYAQSYISRIIHQIQTKFKNR